jgi:hypothetical protein
MIQVISKCKHIDIPLNGEQLVGNKYVKIITLHGTLTHLQLQPFTVETLCALYSEA